jgi:hypothetical protein
MITTSEPRGLLALATTLLMAHSGSGFLTSADGRTYWVFGSVPRNELDFLLLFFFNGGLSLLLLPIVHAYSLLFVWSRA